MQGQVRAFSVTPVAKSSMAVARGQKPSIELAKAMPRDFCDMSNEALCIYSAQVEADGETQGQAQTEAETERDRK